MSDPQPPLNRTPAREAALRDVVMGLISYNPLTGVYLQGGQQVSGPKRRTLAEDLRGNGYIRTTDTRKVAPMALTNPAGEELAIAWGLKNPPAASEEDAVPVAAEETAE